MTYASGSSFTRQTLEIFVPSAKVKRGLLLRPLTISVEVNGLSQLFIRSSFGSQTLEIFVASAKTKSGFSLRPLTNFLGLTGFLSFSINESPFYHYKHYLGVRRQSLFRRLSQGLLRLLRLRLLEFLV